MIMHNAYNGAPDMVYVSYAECIDACLSMCHEYPTDTDRSFDFVDECLSIIVDYATPIRPNVFGFISGLILRDKLAAAEREYLQEVTP